MISAIILAGGRSRRMGGADKSWLLLAGKPLIVHVLERIRPQVDQLLLSVNSDDPRYAGLGLERIKDRPGQTGPLAGLAAGLTYARHELVLTVPCDMPLLPLDVAARLSEALLGASADLAVAQAGGRLHHAVMLCRKSLLPGLESWLAEGGLRVGAWQAGQKTVTVTFGEESFGNINTPDALTALVHRLESA